MIIKLQSFPAGGVLAQGDLIQRATFNVITNLLGKFGARCSRVIGNVEKRKHCRLILAQRRSQVGLDYLI